MLRSIRKCRRGANAVEFALTIPMFVVITFGMIEFGWYFSRVAQVNSASLDGCRAGGLVDENLGDPATVAQARMGVVLGGGGLACAPCSASISGAVPVKALNCTTTIVHDGLTGLLPLPSTISTTTRVRLEWQR